LTLRGLALWALVLGFLGLVVGLPLIGAIVVTINWLYFVGGVGVGEGGVAAASG
ncbi:MAG: hypothetical protein QOJ16_2368, partial [Acidobacteriota bacterium]|nr:hypothetical protein [Acidobacteriota bacterium]